MNLFLIFIIDYIYLFWKPKKILIFILDDYLIILKAKNIKKYYVFYHAPCFINDKL